MLNIMRSMKTLKGELQSAKSLCMDIIGTLESIDSHTNLTQSVGIFVRQMPDYKVLIKDSDSAKQILRKVCTGEIEPKEAAESFKSALKEVDTLLRMFEGVTLP